VILTSGVKILVKAVGAMGYLRALAVDSQASNEAMAVTIDKQLAGASATGERPYRSRPSRLATPSRGYPLPFTPAEFFRTSLAAIEDQDIAAVAAPFEQANLRAQAATK
jgi:hypothetical protein